VRRAIEARGGVVKKLFAVAACATSLVSCGGGGGGSPPPPPPPATTFTVSGTVSAVSATAVDSDTNDPLQQGRANNNAVANPQLVGNPALVIGYLNKPGQGPDGPNRAAGDEWDLYRVTLSAGQVVELNFGDPNTADLDLYIADTAGTILARSIGTSRSECVRINTSGDYLVGVNAFSGFANYQLAWGPNSLGTSCPNATLALLNEPSFVPGQFFVKAKSGTQGETRLAKTAAVARAAQLSVASLTWHDGPVLLELPLETNARATSMRALAGQAKVTEITHAVFEGAPPQAELAYDTAVAIKQLRASGQFEYVEPNGVVQAQQVGYGPWPPNDPLLNRMPQLDLIKLPDAFNALNALNPRPTYTPIVAVVDTGIVADHPDLTRMIVPGYDMVADPNNGGDGNGLDTNPDDSKPAAPGAVFHGTHVAGTIAAETFNGVGVVGIAPMARIMPVRVLGSNGSGSFNDILQGMLFAAGLPNNSGTVPARKADVINMSLGGQGGCPQQVRDVVQQVRGQGVIVVAAAGNDSGQPVGTPANCQGAIAVSAMAYSGALARYSNVGPEVVVTAPGGDQSRQSPSGVDEILSTHATFPTNSNVRTPNFAGLQGTSMATPHVAGVMALMRAVNPNITPAQIDALFANGSITDDVGAAGRDNQFGFGLINALKAITAAGAGGGQPPPPPGGLPTLELSTTRLDFGTVQTQLQLTVTRVNGSTDSPASAIDSAANPNAVTVAASGPAAGPYVLTVTIDRALLNPGEDQIQVEITSAQGRKLRFDVVVAPRGGGAPVGLRGVGPVYVLALNPNTLATMAQANVTANSTTYPYTLANLNGPVIIVAGTDTDNDGFICGSSEPCGAYPVLGVDATILNSSRNGVNFDLMIGASAGNVGAGTPIQLPARGFARIR
jgi:serine protease